MSDKELIRTILFQNEWTQGDLSERIGVSQQQISHVVNERSQLGKAARILAEQLFSSIQPEQQPA